MTDSAEKMELKFWWSDDEEIIRSEAFETREQAYSDAYCSRAQCFDDTSQSDGFYLHHGKMVPNPDYDADYAKHYGGFDEDNAPTLFEGKTERIEALKVTDMFHDQWVKAPTRVTGDEVGEAKFIGDRRLMVDPSVPEDMVLFPDEATRKWYIARPERLIDCLKSIRKHLQKKQDEKVNYDFNSDPLYTTLIEGWINVALDTEDFCPDWMCQTECPARESLKEHLEIQASRPTQDSEKCCCKGHGITEFGLCKKCGGDFASSSLRDVKTYMKMATKSNSVNVMQYWVDKAMHLISKYGDKK